MRNAVIKLDNKNIVISKIETFEIVNVNIDKYKIKINIPCETIFIRCEYEAQALQYEKMLTNAIELFYEES